MSTRPRRAAASRSTRAGQPDDSNIDPDADPDFLALSARQRRAINKAFERGLRAAGAGGRKRRKLDKGKGVDVASSGGGDGGFVDDGAAGGFLNEEGGAGGFVDDADAGGGFMLDDEDGAGGFMPDDAGGAGGGFLLDDGDDDMGGFMPDEGPSGSVTAPTTRTNTRPTTPAQKDPNARIPLHVLPGLLGSLDLPTDDDVLAVFRASATGWDDDGDDAAETGDSARRRKRGEGGEDEMTGGGVGRKDFRAVCAALMGPDESPERAEDAAMSSDDASDTFELDEAEDESSLSDVSSGSYGRGKGAPKGKAGGKGAATGTGQSARRGRKNKALEEDERVKLSSRQREMVAAIWAMIKPHKATSSGPQRGGMVLGRDELKVVVRDFGEMWTDEEITDMITLFSSQHEARGLTFDDFGAVMLRAGLV